MNDMFKWHKGCDTYQPIVIKIITDCQGTDECQNYEYIFICRELTSDEEVCLSEANTPEEIRDLVDDIREINEPTVYEFDFTTY